MSARDGRPRLQDLPPERYRRCSDLAERLRGLSPRERAEALEALGGDDAELRPYLERLLGEAAEALEARSLGRAFAAAAADLLADDGEGDEPPLPERMGRYAILGRLGAGGMGLVLEAWDERLGRRIAIKTVAPRLAVRPDFRARLEREARAAATLSHPGIVTIHSIEEDGDALFLTMELVEGEPLSRRIPAGGLDAATLLDWGLQLTDAVAAAHARGIVHRDLKPANVIVTPEDRLKVLDFGLALLGAAAPAGSGEPALRTRPGELLGTPAYMSPEQLQGRPADPRTDTWSLGVVLHEMAVGRRPFQGDSEAALAAAILRDEPAALSEGRADAPPALAELVRRCLEKDPARRPSHARELHRELRALRGPTSLSSGARPAAGRGRLPAPRTSFVGRERELAELDSALEEARLVTVTGLGGCGKTRLVLQHARSRREHWPGGAWFCDLSEARDVAGIAQAVASALEVPLGQGDPVLQLGHAIAGRGRCLVVLDNFEQVVEQAEPTLGAWLERCGEASFLVTSREVLRLAGEAVLPLEPLPAAGAAIELFVERAAAQQRDFALGEENREEVAQLVALLDGLPLAIELAAARMRVLSTSQLLENLRDRFRLLVGARGARRRQATLQATLDWSWELLESWERAALAQCSVFEGGFTLAAAEAVLDLSAWPEAPWAMDAVQWLVDKSLLWRRAGARRRGAAGEPRLGTYVSIHEYASAKLRTPGAIDRGGSGPAAERAAQERHGRYFAAFGSDEAAASLHGPGGGERRRLLAEELDNLVAACTRAAARGDGATAVGAMRAAWFALRSVGPTAPASALAAEVLALDSLSTDERCRALLVAAESARSAGRTDEALSSAERALALAREAGDRLLEGTLLNSLGVLLQECGRADEAWSHYEQAMTIHRELGDARGRATGHSSLGTACWQWGRLEEARHHYERSLELHRETGNRRSESHALSNLGILHLTCGRPEQAREHFEASLSLSRELGERRSEGHVLGHLGILAQQLGRPDEAVERYSEALAIHRTVGERRWEGIVLGDLGTVHLARGRLDAAYQQLEPALAIHREVGNRRFEGISLDRLGTARLLEGRTAEAAEHFEQALSIAREIGDRRAEAESLGHRAGLHLDEGRGDEAGADLEAALKIARELGDRRLEGLLLSLRGRLLTDGGRLPESRAAFEQGEALLREVGAELALGELAARRGRLALGEGDAAAARRDLEEAAAVAERFGAEARSKLAREIARLRGALDG